MESTETNQVRRVSRLPTLAILLAVLTVVAYLPALRGEFLWDDDILITENRMVKANDGLYRFWFTTEGPDYWPLTSSAWWLEWRLWGTRPLGYHTVNVVLHAANAILVWIVLKRLRVPGAWLAGCVFALHPVNVASVAWISEQKNTLSMLFCAIAILLYLRFDEDGNWRWYGLSLAAFLLALFSKTAVVMLPVVLLGCIWWTRGRVRRRDFLRSLPFFVLSLVMGLVTVWYQYPRAAGGQAIRTEGFFTRLAVAGSTPWFYLGKTLLPINLTVIYPKWDIDASRWVSYTPGVILIGSLALFWWNRTTWGRPFLFGLGCFVAALVPVSGIFHQNFHMHSFVADHWLYHSIAAPIALVVAAGAGICRRLGPRGRSVGVVASVGMVIVLGAATWGRSRVYASGETLWRDNVAKNPEAWAAQFNLGNVVERAGRIQEAMGRYEQALRIKSDYAEAHVNLGAALIKQGKPEEAIRHYEAALRLNPDEPEAHNDLGNALFKLGRGAEAVAQYEQALHHNADSPAVHFNMGTALRQLGRLTEAIGEYEQALRLRPDYPEAHNNLGLALQGLGRETEAAEHYTEALRLRPDFPEAHSNLGNALFNMGKMSQAVGEYEEALRLRPDDAETRNNLGNALSELGRIPEAIRQYELALVLKPDYAEAHYELGVALEQAGRVREAVGHYEQALRIRPDFARARNRLARLQAGQ